MAVETHKVKIDEDGSVSPSSVTATMGSCVHIDFEWAGLEGTEVAVIDARPAVLAYADLAVVEGRLEMRLHRPVGLTMGRTNRFRLERRVPGHACPVVSRDVWIEVV